ncbi:MAG: S8 family serine peptidase [Acidobacteriota bacterium]
MGTVQVITIPGDWRSTYPFSQRFVASPKSTGEPASQRWIDLAAIRFATDALVDDNGQGDRSFRMPDLASFPQELVRQPFANAAAELFVVQAAGPKMQLALHATLRNLGIAIHGYVPQYAYLAELTAQQVSTLAARPEVAWLGLYQPAWRVDSKLDYLIETHPSQPLRFTALFESAAFDSSDALTTAVSAAGLTVLDAVQRPRGFKLRATGRALDARRLAALPGCLWVERFAGYELHNNVARSSDAVATARNGAAGPMMDVEDVWARGLRGEGQIAAVSDTGLSTGDFATLHHDFGQQGSASNPLRVIRAYALGRATWDDNQTLNGGHGTHVAGSLVGNGVRSGADPASNSFPASSYAGTAPKAQLVFQSLLDPAGGLGGIPADLNSLFQPAYDDGARVHSNSWGTPLFGAYSSDSQEVDEFTWDHPNMVIHYTAGNRSSDTSPIDGIIDADAIGAPGTAKNSITVGATENYRPDFIFEAPAGDCVSSDGIEQRTWGWFNSFNFSAAPLFPDLMADNASGLGAFSSRGPTDDGRIKPDVVAPGIAVTSTRTDRFQSYQQWGICSVPAALRPYYITLGGTSMANPLAAGASLLTRQYYTEGWHAEGSRITQPIPVPADGFDPSAALIKATLLNGAWDVAPGQYGVGPTREVPPAWDGGDLPNHAEGYGRVDLEAALFPGSGHGQDPAREMEIHDIAPGLTTGQIDNYTLPVASSADPLVITLVWTDPHAALGAGAKLVNDLDLAVVSPSGTPYFPNGVDRTVGVADRTNNVEQTTISTPEVGNWTVDVGGWSVPGNGLAGTTVQPYALVISGVLAAPCATPATPSGLSATPIGANRIDLTWGPVAADTYRVYRATTPGGPYQRIASGLVTPSFSDTTVSGGSTHYYVVTAVNSPGCESADSPEASALAGGDCTLAPSFDGLTAVAPTDAGGACGLRLSWPAATTHCPGGPPVYNVYRSTTAGFTPGPANLLASCVTTEAYDDTALVSGTEYHYIVRAEDAEDGGAGPCRSGNVDANTLELRGTAGGDGTVLLFADDFDGSQIPSDLWTFGAVSNNPYASGTCAPPPAGGGPPTYANDWYRPETGFCSGNALASNNTASSPTYSTNGDGSVILGLPPSTGAPFTDGGLLLPASATSITLRFDHDYDFESTSSDWDGGRLLISADNWPNFTPLTPVGGYPGSVINTSFFCHPWPGAPAYVADSIGCIPATFDLTAFAGQRIWLTWNHGADSFTSADQGWVIDNVRIEATLPSSCNAAPDAVTFLTATARDGETEIEWFNPDSVNYDSTLIRYRTDTFPTSPSDGIFLADRAGTAGNGDRATHSGLSNGTTYYYTAFVDNGAGVFSAARHVTARPFDTSGSVKWAYSTGASALAPPGIGSVYGVANDRVLHSMETGATGGSWPTGWQPMAMNGPAQARPPIVPIPLGGAAKVAFLGSQDHRVYAVNADDGQQIWASPDLGGLVQASPAGLFTAFGGAHDLILVGTRHAAGNSAFHGLHLADGSIAWTFDNGGGSSALGIIAGGASVDFFNQRVYFASRAKTGGSTHTLWCLSFDNTSASLLWSRALGDIDGSPILHQGRVYVGTNAGEVHALDAVTGVDLWGAPFAAGDGPIKGFVAPRFGTSELLFSSNSTVWSILDNGASASLDWSVPTIPSPSIPLVSITSPHVWVGGSDGQLHQLDLTTATPQASAITLGGGDAAIGSPALDVGDGIAYVGTDAGRLYAVEVPLIGSAPQPQQTRAASGSAATTPASATTPADAKTLTGLCEEIRVGSPQIVFADGFEAGDLSAWQGGEPTASTFTATNILDLDFQIHFTQALEGDHLLRLRLSTPKGHLFQEVTLPIATDPGRRGASRRVPGFPRPLPIRTTESLGGIDTEQLITVPWPVAGTPIVSSSLYGEWTVAAFLDDSNLPCSSPTTFRLAP